MKKYRKILLATVMGSIIFGLNACSPDDITVPDEVPDATVGIADITEACNKETEKEEAEEEVTEEKGTEYGMETVKEYAVYEKPRVINITDLLADPDDEQSLIRMFVTSNMVDLEGIIVSTSCWRKNQDMSGMNKLQAIVDAYGEVLPNLKKHADGYPEVEYIKSICVFGQKGYSMDDVGDQSGSAGSELIIAAVDKEDSRPVWVNLWGGANTLAQALWKVKNTRTEAEVEAFVSKLRVYDVLGQDEAGAWIVTNFPELMYIRALQVYGFGGDSSLSDYEWRKENVISHGPLGALYPLKTGGGFEGDSPSFMYQMPTGMNDPEHPDWGSFGGRFSLEKRSGIRSMSAVKSESIYDPYYMIGDAPEKNSAISRWQKAYQNDFAARMDWSITENYEDANHHPIAVLNGDTTTEIIEITAKPGEIITLSANGSYDPDGDKIAYQWEFYKEPSSYAGYVSIDRIYAADASFKIPSDATGKTIHIILSIHDVGEPRLYAFRRLIVSVE